MFTRFRLHAPAWRRALRRRRRLLLALAVTALVAAMLPSMMPPSAQGIEVVVVDAPVEEGTVLEASHLRTVRVAAELAPAGSALSPEEVVGRTTVVPLPAGTPLLPGMLEDESAARISEGQVAMVVPAPEALEPHLSPGVEVVLLVSDPTGLGGTAITASVLEVSAPSTSTAALGGSTGVVEVLVAVGREESREVAHALRAGAATMAVIG